MRRALALAVTATVLLGGAHAASADARGRRPRANAVTPQGWRVTPAGREIGVSRLEIGFQGPLGADLSPDGSRLLAASSGSARIESADLFDLRRRRRTDYQPYDAYTGLRPDGRTRTRRTPPHWHTGLRGPHAPVRMRGDVRGRP